MFLLIALFLSVMFSINTQPMVSMKHVDVVYQRALKLNPTANKKWLKELTREITIQSRKNKFNPMLVLAMAKVESGLRNINRVKRGVITDYGVFQIHRRTIKLRNFDAKRILREPKYAVQSFFVVINIKKHQCRQKRHPWACYHSKTKKLYNRYVKKVRRHL